MPAAGVDPIFDERVAAARRRQGASMEAYGAPSKPMLFGTGGAFDAPYSARNADRRYDEAMARPAIGETPKADAPIEAPGQTINPFPREPFKIGSDFRMKGVSDSPSGVASATSPSRRSGGQGITPGLRAGAERIASDIGDRPDFSGNHSAADLESGARAKNFLEGIHQQDLLRIGADDPYERARTAEREADADRLSAEDAGLVDAPGDPGITQIGGVYKTTRKAPRQSGAERKKSLEQRNQAGFAYDKARSAEQQKMQAETSRRNAFMQQAIAGLDQEYEQKAMDLEATMKGDQLRLALQELNKKKRQDYQDAMTNAFQIGARFDLR